MSKLSHCSYIIIICVLVISCILLFNRSGKVEVVEKRVTDTLYQTKIDTVIHTKVTHLSERVVDTIYVSNDCFINLPITQKHYSSLESYDVWVSGYNTKLDSIKTYPKTIYKTITNEITREYEVSRVNLYAYIGIKRFSSEYIPSIGLMFKGRKNWIYGAEIGFNGSNNMYWGVNMGYKLK